MDLLPVFSVAFLFLARLVEMGFRKTGHCVQVASIWSLPLMLISGIVTVAGSIWEYLIVHRSCEFITLVVGLCFGISSFYLRHRAAHALGLNWSMHASIREAHTLVTEGPYAYVRHPIYSAACLELLGAVISLRSVTGLVLLVIFALPVIFLRMRGEEKLLSARFGDAYTNYCERTPRLLGLINRSKIAR